MVISLVFCRWLQRVDAGAGPKHPAACAAVTASAARLTGAGDVVHAARPAVVDVDTDADCDDETVHHRVAAAVRAAATRAAGKAAGAGERTAGAAATAATARTAPAGMQH